MVSSNIGVLEAITPLIMVIVLNAIFTYLVLPNMDWNNILSEKFANVNPRSWIGFWSIVIALLISCTWLIASRWRKWVDIKDTVNKGCLGSMLPIFNTASEVGYGAVIASLAGFVIVRDFILGIAPGNPLISEAISMTTLAGITGSSSGGLGIALGILGQQYFELAQNLGINPELMHRVATIAAGGLDTLPHSGAVITLLAICGMTHRKAYLNLAMVTIAVPLLTLVTVIILGSLFGSF